MNGIRRLLDAATGSPSTSTGLLDSLKSPTQAGPTSANPAPSWPPSLPPTPLLRDGATTPPISPAIRRKPMPPLPQRSHSKNTSSNIIPSTHARAQSSTSTSSSSPPKAGSSSWTGSPTSSPYIGPSRIIARKSVPKVDGDQEGKRSSMPLNPRDELLVSLLASEAVVDSREFDILSSEEVEELKKEHHVLQSRLGAATKKLALETKIRDAAKSLVKVNAANKRASKQSEEQLDAANKRVDAAQTELLRISQRANDVHRRLMEHRAGVLSLSVRSMEKKLTPGFNGTDSGYNSPVQTRTPSLSPSRSIVSATSGPARFDGAHLFAGHIDAVVPKRWVSPDTTAAEINVLEEKLKAATEALTTAGKKQAELQRELSLLRLEKQEVETSMVLELQSAEETISALEQELPRLETLEQQHLEEKSQWGQERAQLQERGQLAEELQARLRDMEARDGEAAAAERALTEEKERSKRELQEKDDEVRRLKDAWEQERDDWESERATMQDEKLEDLARLQDELEQQKEEDLSILRRAGEELEEGLGAMESLLEALGIYSRDPSLPGMVQAIDSHFEQVQKRLEFYEKAEEDWSSLRRTLEDDIRSGLDKREALQMELEEARKGRDAATLQLNKHLAEPPMPVAPPSPIEINVPLNTNVAKATSILLPVWALLPSPEVRAAKFGTSPQRHKYTNSSSWTGTSSPPPKSIADLDVRSLKALYDSSRAGSPPGGAGGTFSFEAFAARVQALIADDRALIERLIRFAQAHDLLRKNAERAQKLAQDGTGSLETYQKQVRTLEERNMGLASRVMELQEDVQFLQDTVDQLSAEKQALEVHVMGQEDALQQLTEDNHMLAEQAANGSEQVRMQLEAQLADYRNKLQAAQTELNAMVNLEQTQRIAMMDELNSVQTENDRLRDQLRAIKR